MEFCIHSFYAECVRLQIKGMFECHWIVLITSMQTGKLTWMTHSMKTQKTKFFDRSCGWDGKQRLGKRMVYNMIIHIVKLSITEIDRCIWWLINRSDIDRTDRKKWNHFFYCHKFQWNFNSLDTHRKWLFFLDYCSQSSLS